MVAIGKGSLVLVTGASGFIAAHVVRELLRAGFKVRGTVRSASKGDYLKGLFKDEGESDYAIVADMGKGGAFDEVVKGVAAVVHTASPFHFKVTHPNELIEPAINGTVGVLRSIKRNNPGMKRVVVTSSCAAVQQIDSVKPPHVFQDNDWNTDAPRIVKEQGDKTDPVVSYLASKSLAEQASGVPYIKDEDVSFDGVSINPPLVLGEMIHQCDNIDSLNTSLADLYPYAAGEKSEEDLKNHTGIICWVNVRDLARAHVQALLVPEAGGERFTTSAGPFAAQDWCDVLHKRFPDLPNVPVGKPETHDQLCEVSFGYNSERSKRILGVEYTGWEETIVEAVKSLRERFQF